LRALKAKQSISQFVPEGHQVKVGTPNMGGLIPIFGVLVTTLAYLMLPVPDQVAKLLPRPTAIGVLVLVIALTLVGFVDDYVVPRWMKGKRGLGWTQKLLAQFAIVLVVCLISEQKDPMKIALTLIVVLFFSNAYNFSDGLDSLSSLILIAFALGLIGLGLMLPVLAPGLFYGVVLLAAILPFLFLNWYPAKVFMGDTGSLPIGGLLGFVLTPLFFGDQATVVINWGHFGVGTLLSLIMIAELIPPPLQIASVKLFKRKLFPYTPIHHAFEKAGWPETRVVGMFFIGQLLSSAAAITLAKSLS
jgi:phospho-N-acetylmuramoyl-pentapeptide-transferase